MKRLLSVSLSCAALSVAVLIAPGCKKKEEPAPAGKPADKAPSDKKDEAKPVAEKPPTPPTTPAAGTVAAAPSAEVAKLGVVIPADASAVIGVDVQALTQAFFWGTVKGELEKSPENKANYDKVKACGYEPEKLNAVVVGIDQVDEQAVVALSGAGIGKLSQLECLAKAVADSKNEEVEPPKVEKRGNRDVLVFKPKKPGPGDHTMLLLAPSEDQLAFFPEPNLSEIEKQLAAGGEGVFGGALKDVLAKTDKARAIWFAGSITKESAQNLDMVKLSTAQDFMGGLDFRTGLKFNLSFGVDNPASAASAVDALKTQYEQQKPMLSMFGLPATLADKVTFTAKEARVEAGLDLGAEEFKQAIENVKRVVQGMMGAGAGQDGTADAASAGDKGAQPAKKADASGKGAGAAAKGEKKAAALPK